VINRLPPLRSIETFIVAAQSLSFTDTAAALYVTVPAISRRIQALEAELGVTLFQRTHRSLKLTAVGSEYVKLLVPAVENIRQACERIRSNPPRDVVKICIRPLFAISWLFPRLGRFAAQHPGIKIEYETSNHEVDLEDCNADVAIRFGTGDWPGLFSVGLLSVTCFPICSARFRNSAGLSSKPSDVFRHQLIGSVHEPDLWLEWLRAAGHCDTRAPQMLNFDNFQLCYEAALNDLGISIGLDIFSERYLREHKLIRPFEVVFTPKKRFYAVCRPHDRDRPTVRRLMEWLQSEAMDGQKCRSVA
jgi:LysR family glycine cleavage system transcriptional activator